MIPITGSQRLRTKHLIPVGENLSHKSSFSFKQGRRTVRNPVIISHLPPYTRRESTDIDIDAGLYSPFSPSIAVREPLTTIRASPVSPVKHELHRGKNHIASEDVHWSAALLTGSLPWSGLIAAAKIHLVFVPSIQTSEQVLEGQAPYLGAHANRRSFSKVITIPPP